MDMWLWKLDQGNIILSHQSSLFSKLVIVESPFRFFQGDLVLIPEAGIMIKIMF